MKNSVIANIVSSMADSLMPYQLTKLEESLVINFEEYDLIHITNDYQKEQEERENDKLLNMFLSSKKVEGCSDRTITYYEEIINKLIDKLDSDVKNGTTDNIRDYLSQYKDINNCSSVTIDNIRRVISSFYSWLEDEDYIIKSPVRRIHKVKTAKVIKETFSDENIEKMRDECSSIRDLSLIEFLISTGVRVGEIINLNIEDINFEDRSCIVLGKGNKEREVYFDARTKIHLMEYIEKRKDTNNALFVSERKPHQRLTIAGIELIIRKLGIDSDISKAHPHKFRRTLATNAIDKGMPIEQVQKLLGHVKIETTMQYAMVNQSNVKNSHRKYIG